jgi:hypothetical protein
MVPERPPLDIASQVNSVFTMHTDRRWNDMFQWGKTPPWNIEAPLVDIGPAQLAISLVTPRQSPAGAHRNSRLGRERPHGSDAQDSYTANMNPLLLILVLLVLFGGGGFYLGGPAIGGGGLGLILLVCLVVFAMGGFRGRN